MIGVDRAIHFVRLVRLFFCVFLVALTPNAQVSVLEDLRGTLAATQHSADTAHQRTEALAAQCEELRSAAEAAVSARLQAESRAEALQQQLQLLQRKQGTSHGEVESAASHGSPSASHLSGAQSGSGVGAVSGHSSGVDRDANSTLSRNEALQLKGMVAELQEQVRYVKQAQKRGRL